MMHEEVDRLEMSQTDYRFKAKNKSIFIEGSFVCRLKSFHVFFVYADN